MLVPREVNLEIYSKAGYKLFVGIFLGLVVSSCGENKYTQCEQIFHIARGVTENSKDVNYIYDEQPTEMKSWLETARMIDTAADRIKALHINNSNLIKYQNKFATVYHIYSQAIYDAVQARENKNLEALKSARNDAEKAGQIQQNLIQEINAYCLKK